MTSGLAVAFDTTLVALVASILVMLPTSWLQKAEEKLVSDVDDYCVTGVLCRLATPEPTAASEAKPAEGALEPALVRQVIVDTLAAPLAEMLSANARLLARLTEDREAVRQTQLSFHEQLAAFGAASRTLESGVAGAVTQLERATGVAERATGAMARAEDQLCRELGASRQLLQLLAAGLGASARASDDALASARHANGANGVNGTNGASRGA